MYIKNIDLDKKNYINGIDLFEIFMSKKQISHKS